MKFADEESVTAILTLESLPLFNGKRLTVKERTINKSALQLNMQKSRKRKRHDSRQDPEGQQDNKEMASFLSEDLITKLKSSLTVSESCILDLDDYEGIDFLSLHTSLVPWHLGIFFHCTLIQDKVR